MRSTSPVWRPFTQHAVHGEIPTIVSAEGTWLEAAGGRRIFDAIASWWVVTHGHRSPPIMQAIRTQTNLLDQIIFAGFTRPPAEQPPDRPRSRSR
jgi:adenosylmethionine-8-amino-7-oxononanoate aminotransferase